MGHPKDLQLDWLIGGDERAELVGRTDWSKTPLGAIEPSTLYILSGYFHGSNAWYPPMMSAGLVLGITYPGLWLTLGSGSVPGLRDAQKASELRHFAFFNCSAELLAWVFDGSRATFGPFRAYRAEGLAAMPCQAPMMDAALSPWALVLRALDAVSAVKSNAPKALVAQFPAEAVTKLDVPVSLTLPQKPLPVAGAARPAASRA